MALHTVIAASDLREGDLVHIGGTNYVLVAGTHVQDGQIRVTIYNGSTAHPEPTIRYVPGDRVRLSMRGLSPDSTIRTRPEWNTYYNETPGHAPEGSRCIPVGAVVAVRPAYGIGPVRHGRVQAHQHSKADGTYLGVSVIGPADPGDTRHSAPGTGQVAEIGDLTLIGSWSASAGREATRCQEAALVPGAPGPEATAGRDDG